MINPKMLHLPSGSSLVANDQAEIIIVLDHIMLDRIILCRLAELLHIQLMLKLVWVYSKLK